MRTRNRIVSILIILALLLSLLPTTALAEGEDEALVAEDVKETVETTVVPDAEDLPDCDDLLMGYLEQELFGIGGASLYSNYETGLETADQTIYTYLKNEIKNVAEGTRTSTQFTLPEATMSELSLSWSYTQLGLDSNPSEEQIKTAVGTAFSNVIHTKSILNYLLVNCPYDLYWFDKTTGMASGYSYSSNGSSVTITGITFSFSVAAEYSVGGNQIGTFVTNGKPEAVTTALTKINQIIETHKSEMDYQKLVSYRNEICSLTSYNSAAVSNTSTPYGNPWQLIWVFDDNVNTEVVCEGYAKAFQYLCDLSSFKSTKVNCYTVTGDMSGGTGAGGHMWNIVTMEDDQNYLVDVTNCDESTVGADDKLFLVGTSGDVASGYSFSIGETTITYAYDTDTKSLYGNSILTLASSDYTPKTVLSGAQAVTITAPVKGATPQAAIADAAGWTGTITWLPDDATFAPSTLYTASVELTAKSGYLFASDATGSVSSATTVSGNKVSANGSTLSFKATFPKTADVPSLSGIVIIDGTPKFDATLTANTSSLVYDSAGTLSYQWKRDDAAITGATNSTYTLTEADIGKTITVEVKNSNNSASVTSAATDVVAKADGPAAPAAPTLSSKTHNSITVTTVSGQEYATGATGSAPDTEWTTTGIFSGLFANTTYYVFTRVASTATHNASAASDSLSVTTDKAPLTSVTISGMVDPIKGNTPIAQEAVTVTGNVADVTSLGWKTGDSTFTGDKFAASTVYTVEITLTAKDGNSFAEGVTCSGYNVTWNSATQIMLTKTFDATSAKTITALEVTNYSGGQKIHGNTVAMSELTVKATYDDSSVDTAFTGYEIVYISGAALQKGDNTIKVKVGSKEASVTIPTVKGLPAVASNYDLTGASSLTYDDSAFTVGVKKASSDAGVVSGSISFTYSATADGTYTFVSEVKNAGYYKVIFNTDESGVYEPGTGLVLSFSVGKKVLSDTNFTMGANPTYTGSSVNAPITTSLTTDDYEVSGTAALTDVQASDQTITFTGKGNYSGTISKTWNLAKAPLTLPNASVDNKAYDENKNATIRPGTLSSVFSADSGMVFVAEESITGTFADQYVGTGKSVNANANFSLIGEKASNYTLTQPTGLTGTITAATQTLNSSYTTEAVAKQLTKGHSVDLLDLVGTNAPAKTGISFAINSGTSATLDGTTLTASSSTAGTVTVTVKGAAYDVNTDGTAEYSAATDLTIYVEVVGKPTYSLAVTQQNGTYGTELPDPTYSKPEGTTNTTIIYSTGLSSKPTAVGNGYTVTVTCETPEYIYTGTSNTFSIEQRWLIPKLTGSVSKSYDGYKTITDTSGLIISLDGLNGLVGIVGSDDVRVSTATFTFNDSNVGDDKQVNANDITLAGAQKDNYRLYVSTCSANVGTITKSTPTIAFNGYTPSKTFDGTSLANPTSFQLTIHGASYENVTFTWYKDSVAEGNKLTAAPKDAGTYVVVASIPATANTDAASVTSGTISISAKTVSSPTITLNEDSYTYDGTAKEPTVTVKDGETIISSGEYTVGYTNNTDVGTATVTITNNAGGNYTVSGSTTFAITKADQSALNITSATTMIYGETLTLTANGGTGIGAVTFSVEAGGTGAATISGTTLTATKAGMVIVKAVKDGGANYNNATATATIAINKADPNVGTVSVSAPANIFISTALNTITLTKDGSTAGTLALDAGQTLTVGDHAYNWTFTPTDITNYNTATGTVMLHVAEDTLSSIAVTGTPTKTAYKFGEPFETAGLTVTATYASGNHNDVTPNVTFDALAVGQTEITLSYTEGSVTETCTVNGITVSKAAAPAVSGVDRTFVRTSTTSGNTVSIASLLPANRGTTTYAVTSTTYAALESVSVSADGTLTFGTKAMGSEVVDTITVKAVMQNYEDATATVTVKLISKTPVTITGVTPMDGTYNDSAHRGYSGTPTSSSYTGTYTVTYTGRAGTVYNSAVAPVNAGSYTVTFRVPDSDPTYAGSAELDFTIAKATITITAGSKSAYVGDAVPTLDSNDCTVAGLVGEDVLAAAPTVAYDGTPDMTKAGTVAIKASGAVVPAGGNYEDEITYVDGTLTISSRPYYGGGSSSGGSSSSSTTTTNKDGSTTTTTVNKSTGTVTEVTKEKDGTTTTVETKKDGTVTETVKTPDGTTGTVVTDKDGNVTEAKANVSTAAAKEAGKTGEAVTLPVEVPAVTSTEDAPAVNVSVPKSAGSVKVEIPVENVTPGTVAVIVKADGTEEIVSTSVVTENGVALTLDGSTTVKIFDNAKSFTDVSATNVFYNEICSLSAREIMVGKTGDTFDLYSSVTLNQIANVAGRIIGAVDVSDYNGGIAWGAENGLKTGNVSATRGDVLKALYIAAGFPAVDDLSVLNRFNDAGSIPADMAAAAAWAAQNGILKGTVDGKANLGVNVTRGQSCALAGRAMATLA